MDATDILKANEARTLAARLQRKAYDIWQNAPAGNSSGLETYRQACKDLDAADKALDRLIDRLF